MDIGVHQDGLVHISALADKFVKDPYGGEGRAGGEGEGAGVDEKRKRISLTMRLTDTPEGGKAPVPRDKAPVSRNNDHAKRGAQHKRQETHRQQARQPEPQGAMAAAFAKLKK